MDESALVERKRIIELLRETTTRERHINRMGMVECKGLGLSAFSEHEFIRQLCELIETGSYTHQ